jgi:hypothetical protein
MRMSSICSNLLDVSGPEAEITCFVTGFLRRGFDTDSPLPAEFTNDGIENNQAPHGDFVVGLGSIAENQRIMSAEENEWRDRNWGTKWNAAERRLVSQSSNNGRPALRTPYWGPEFSSQTVLGAISASDVEGRIVQMKESLGMIYKTSRISFETAYCYPEAWLRTVGIKYPTLEFFLHHLNVETDDGGLCISGGKFGCLSVYIAENGTELYHNLCSIFALGQYCLCARCACSECGDYLRNCECGIEGTEPADEGK